MIADVVAAVARRELQPVEPRTYPLTDVAEALTDQIERRAVGKSVLLP
jgi:NADPH:quinone reductase-like Zn-dependent oxidoreductase